MWNTEPKHYHFRYDFLLNSSNEIRSLSFIQYHHRWQPLWYTTVHVGIVILVMAPLIYHRSEAWPVHLPSKMWHRCIEITMSGLIIHVINFPNTLAKTYLDVKVRLSPLNLISSSFPLVDKSRGMSYTIGLQDYAYWINMNRTDNPLPSIVYPSPSMNQRLTVQLVCDRSYSSHRLEVLGETSIGEYTMQLTSRCACWNGCARPSPHPHPFDWNIWIITGGICAVLFFLSCTMITCLFCSKPKRDYPILIANEKTPFIKAWITYHT